jgi:nitroreductase/ubiquinone/menaquinone biosynthesis C-methylase UbiE
LRLWYSFVRFAFRHFYNEFAWTYDWVSRIVSRGRWHDWQRAALPELRGQRVLEVAFGTGNLLWDMVAEGYLCVGVERSPYMASITARKFRRRGGHAPICRAVVQGLPFADGTFDSLVATFPDYFILDPVAQGEMARVLVPGGRLVAVEGGYILKEGVWSRFLNWAFRVTVSPRTWKEVQKLFTHPLFSVERREVQAGWSSVGVIVAVKKQASSGQSTGRDDRRMPVLYSAGVRGGQVEVDLDEAIRERRSIRKYKSGVTIPREDIEAIIEAGSWAPSSTNIQPWRFIVVEDRDTIAKMAQVVYDKFQALSKEALTQGEKRIAAFCRFLRSYTSFFTDAPLVIVACTKPYENPVLKMPMNTVIEKTRALGDVGLDVKPIVIDTVQKSVAMAVQNMLLKAHSLGYGTCAMDGPLAVGETMRDMLGIEDGLDLVMFIPMGVPEAAQVEAPERLPVAEVIRYFKP